MFLDSLKKYINDPQRDVFSISVEQQQKILDSIAMPHNNIERSYDQYICQMRIADKKFRFRSNVLSFFLFWGSFIFVKRSKAEIEKAKEIAVFISSKDNRRCIPESLEKEYETIENYCGGMKLSWKDKRFLLGIFVRYPFSYFFLLKILVKMAIYRMQIDAFSPKAIITTAEYSFTSSVLTDFCHMNGVEHINVLHGEKLFYIRDSFYHFDRCYVWDEFYTELGKMLRAEETQFIVERSPAQQPWGSMRVDKSIDYTYYLQAENESELSVIKDCLCKLKDSGNKIAVRPHPVYSDIELIKNLFIGFEIEDKDDIGIEHSVLRTRNVVSLYSTVLSQALNNDIEIIIDDVSNLPKYLQLKELRFICLNKSHKLLSEVIGE